MKAQVKSPSPKLAPRKPPELADMFRQFVIATAEHSVTACAPPREPSRPAEQTHLLQFDNEPTVLFETTFDGMRYTLTCQQIKNNREDERIHLSPREHEILRLIAKGLPNKSIASVLDISIWTVSTHVRRIFAKLHASSRAEAVAQAIAHVEGAGRNS